MSRSTTQRERLIGWFFTIAFVITSSLGAARTTCCCTALSTIDDISQAPAKSSCCVHTTTEASTKSSDEASDSIECYGCNCDGFDLTNKIYRAGDKEVSPATADVSFVKYAIVDDDASSSLKLPHRDSDALISQERCSLYCTWQK